MRQIFPESLPWPPAIWMPKRRFRSPWMALPSTPSGTRNAVTTLASGFSGPSSDSALACTPARVMRPSARWRAKTSCSPSASIRRRASCSWQTSVTDGVNGLREPPLRVRSQSR